jgi:hypothetical protein
MDCDQYWPSVLVVPAAYFAWFLEVGLMLCQELARHLLLDGNLQIRLFCQAN